MPRIRRSLRATTGPPNERFEKLIHYVKRGCYHENLREFIMPPNIIISFDLQPTKSRLELLPKEILRTIVNELTGTDQIIAALSCKAIANAVEASTTHKIANIAQYKQNRRLERPPEGLQTTIGHWLGPEYLYCYDCQKFRPLRPEFWRRFVEYKNPRILQSTCESAVTIKHAIHYWSTIVQDDPRLVYEFERELYVCPAHRLIEWVTVKGARKRKRPVSSA